MTEPRYCPECRRPHRGDPSAPCRLCRRAPLPPAPGVRRCRRCGAPHPGDRRSPCADCLAAAPAASGPSVPCIRCNTRLIPPGRRVCAPCREASRSELLASQRRSPAVDRTEPAAFLPGVHGFEVATFRDRDADEAERARRVKIYAEQLERTGRIDYAAVPLAPAEPRIAPRRETPGGMIRLDEAA